MGRGLSELQKQILRITYGAGELPGRNHLIFTDGSNAHPERGLGFRLFGHSGKSGGALTASERATLSRALSRLQSRGLIEYDARVVCLTPDGVDAVEMLTVNDG